RVDLRGLRGVLGLRHPRVRADERQEEVSAKGIVRARATACLAGVMVAAAACAADAQPKPDPGEIHGLKLGLDARAMSTDGFGELACGSNGGPPRTKLEGFADFAK